MDTLLIKKLLKSFKCFKGVFPSNLIPTNYILPINLIVNTDPSYKAGEHWVCISVNSKRKGFYFDSFGLPPLKEDIKEYLDLHCKEWTYNTVALQNIMSNTCGHYCVLWIIFRCQGKSNEDFISMFGNNTLDNDKNMKAIFENFSLVKEYWKRKV